MAIPAHTISHVSCLVCAPVAVREANIKEMALSKEEYLKRYLSGSSSNDKKKKKHRSVLHKNRRCVTTYNCLEMF